MRLVASLQRRLKVTPQSRHLAVLNHTGQRAGNPRTQERAHGQEGGCLPAQAFRAAGLGALY